MNLDCFTALLFLPPPLPSPSTTIFFPYPLLSYSTVPLHLPLFLSQLYMTNQFPSNVTSTTASAFKSKGEYYICATMPGSTRTTIPRSPGQSTR